MDLIERNLKIIKSLDKSSLYKNLYDNKIKIILCFLLIIIVSFSILYYLYQKYFEQAILPLGLFQMVLLLN